MDRVNPHKLNEKDWQAVHHHFTAYCVEQARDMSWASPRGYLGRSERVYVKLPEGWAEWLMKIHTGEASPSLTSMTWVKLLQGPRVSALSYQGQALRGQGLEKFSYWMLRYVRYLLGVYAALKENPYFAIEFTAEYPRLSAKVVAVLYKNLCKRFDDVSWDQRRQRVALEEASAVLTGTPAAGAETPQTPQTPQTPEERAFLNPQYTNSDVSSSCQITCSTAVTSQPRGGIRLDAAPQCCPPLDSCTEFLNWFFCGCKGVVAPEQQSLLLNGVSADSMPSQVTLKDQLQVIYQSNITDFRPEESIMERMSQAVSPGCCAMSWGAVGTLSGGLQATLTALNAYSAQTTMFQMTYAEMLKLMAGKLITWAAFTAFMGMAFIFALFYFYNQKSYHPTFNGRFVEDPVTLVRPMMPVPMSVEGCVPITVQPGVQSSDRDYVDPRPSGAADSPQYEEPYDVLQSKGGYQQVSANSTYEEIDRPQ